MASFRLRSDERQLMEISATSFRYRPRVATTCEDSHGFSSSSTTEFAIFLQHIYVTITFTRCALPVCGLACAEYTLLMYTAICWCYIGATSVLVPSGMVHLKQRIEYTVATSSRPANVHNGWSSWGQPLAIMPCQVYNRLSSACTFFKVHVAQLLTIPCMLPDQST